MTSSANDPLHNAIQDGIKKGIRVALDNDCHPSALILIYSGIDTMGYLSMPPNKSVNERTDFKKWVRRYIKINSPEKITSEEFYSARCAIIHSYGVQSAETKKGKVRMIGYSLGGYPPILYNPKVDKNLLLLDVNAFAKAFFEGVDQFLIDMYADPKTKAIIEPRVNWLLNRFPLKPQP